MDIAIPSFASLHDDVRCSLKIAGVDVSLVTVAFDGSEGLSRLFSYTIVVDTEREDVDDLELALGRDASFIVSRAGEMELAVHGIVTEVVPDGVFIGKDRARTSIVVEPALANLRHSGGYRIFQQMTVEDIIRELVGPEGIETSWRVYPPLSKREYVVQADESDFYFLSRLAADEGLHFYFDRTTEKTTLVFTNRFDGFTDLERDADLDFHDPGGAVTGEHVLSIKRAQRVRISAVEHRDYDFRSPATVLSARAELPGEGRKRDRLAYPGGFQDAHDLGARRATLRLEQERSDAFVLHGTASTLRFLPGKTFTLSGHRDGSFNRKLLLTEVSVGAKIHGASLLQMGGSGAASEIPTKFHAVPAKVSIHPPRLPKPRAHLESARVVGPKDGDPFVDNFGRIKVQFHWDRYGRNDADSSCWIRMMTPVANFDEGFWQAHKVGSEVLVDFIDGDIDRPVVIGAVYNGIETQPYKMPGDVAKSTWKTKSVPGCGGFNEITQDNSAGAEKIYVHAQKNMDVTVRSNHTEGIGANQTSTIGANRTGTIGANQTTTVGANDTTTVGANQTHSAGAMQSFSAGASQSLSAGSSQSLSAGTDQSLSASANQSLSAGANQSVSVTGTQDVTVQGGSAKMDVTGNYDIKASAMLTITVGGSSLTIDTSSATLTVPSKILLKVGGSTITIDTSKVDIQSALIQAVGPSGMLTLDSNAVLSKGDSKLTLDGNATLEKGGSKVVLDGKATLQGSTVNVTGAPINLNC